MNFDQLKGIITSALREETFLLEATSLENPSIEEKAKNYLEKGCFHLSQAGPVREVQGPGLEISGHGNGIPFSGHKITLKFWIEAGKTAFSLSSCAPEEWILSSSFPELENAMTDQFKFQGSGVKGFRLDSTSKPTMDFEARVDLAAMTSGLSEWLGIQYLDLTGIWLLSENGSRIEKLDLEASIPNRIELGFISVEGMGLLIGFTRSYNAWEDLWSIHPYLGLKTRIILKGEKDYEIGLKAISSTFSKRFRFSADINEVVRMGLNQLTSLGFNQGPSDFLPGKFTLEDWFTIKDFFAEIDPNKGKLLHNLGIDIASSKKWELITLPGKPSPLALEDLLISFRLFNPLEAPDPSLGIEGTLAFGQHARLKLSGMFPEFEMYGALEADEKVPLNEVISNLLAGVNLPIPPSFFELFLTKFILGINFTKKSYQFSAIADASSAFEIAGEKIFVEMEVDSSFEQGRETQFEGKFSGLLAWDLLAFGFELELGKDTSFKAFLESVSLKRLIKILTQTDLPDDIFPYDLLSKKLTLEFEGTDSIRIKGGFEVKEKRVKLGGKEVELLDFEFEFFKDKENSQVDLKFSGKPAIEWIPDIKLKTYSLEFQYHKKKDEPAAWKLNGGLGVSFFETHEIHLSAGYETQKDYQKLFFKGNTLTQQPALPADHFIRINGIDEESSKQLRIHIQSQGFLDDEFRLTNKFTPWKEEFQFPLPTDFKKFKEQIIDLLSQTRPFFNLDIEGTKVLSIDPKTIDFSWEKKNDEQFWKLGSVNDLVFYNPADNHPVLNIKYGQASFTYNTKDKGLKLILKTREGKVSLVDLPYEEVSQIDDKGQVQKVSKRFQALLNFQRLELEKKEGNWSFEASASLDFQDLPKPLPHLLNNRINFRSGFENKKLFFESTDGLKALIIPDLLGEIVNQYPGIKLPEVGRTSVKLTRLRLEIGNEVVLATQLGIALPEKLNEAFGLQPGAIFKTWNESTDKGFFFLNLSIGTGGLSGSMEGSPFVDIKGIEDKGAHIELDFDKIFEGDDLGSIDLKKPKISFDLKKGSFNAKFGYKFGENGIKLPLKPLKQLLKVLDLGQIAESLPSGIPITDIPMTPSGWLDKIDEAKIPIPQPFRDALLELQNHFSKFPKRFTDYLKINIPQSMDLSIDVTADGGVSFSLTTDKEHPVQMILPSQTGIFGFRVSHVSFGTVLGGSLLKVEFTGDFDLFDYLTLATSYFLLDDPNLKPWLPERNQLQRTISIEKLVMFIIYQTTIPIPVPLFYDKLELITVGPEGIEAHGKIGFPIPELNIMEALTILKQVKEFFGKPSYYLPVRRPLEFVRKPPSENDSGKMNLVLNGGPMYLRLPKYIGQDKGQQITLGTTDSVELLDTLNLAGVFLNSAKALFTEGAPAYLVESFRYEHRVGTFSFSLFEKLSLKLAWVFCTPVEFREKAYQQLEADLDEAEVLQILKALPVGRGIPGGEPKINRVEDLDKKGMVAFLGGKLESWEDFELLVAGGLSVSGEGFGTGLRFRGRLGKNMIETGLSGMITLSKGHLRITGNGYWDLLGVRILEGGYFLEGDYLELKGSADLKPLSVNIILAGTLREDLLHLQNKGTMRFWMLEVSGEAELLASPKRSLLRLEGDWAVGSFAALTVKLFSQKSGENLQAGFSVRGTILNLVEADLSGYLSIGNTLQVEGDGKLRILDQEVLSGYFRINEKEGAFGGELNLFPENKVIALKGKLSGTFSQESINFSSEGKFQLLGLGEVEASTLLVAKTTEGSFTATLRGFLGTDFVLALSREGNKFKGISSTAGAVRLLFGAILLTDTGNSQNGPMLAFQLEGGNLESFHLEGAVRILGVSATSLRVNYAEKALVAQIEHKTGNNGIFRSDYTLQCQFSPGTIRATTNLQVQFDIGRAIQEAVKSLTGGLIDIRAEIPVGFNLKELTVRIDGEPPRDDRSEQERRKLEEMRKRIEEEIRKVRDRIKEAFIEGEKQIEFLKATILEHEKELAGNPDPEREQVLRAAISKLNLFIRYQEAIMKDIQKLGEQLIPWIEREAHLKRLANRAKDVEWLMYNISQWLWRLASENKGKEFDQKRDNEARPWAEENHPKGKSFAIDYAYNVWWAHHALLPFRRDAYKKRAEEMFREIRDIIIHRREIAESNWNNAKIGLEGKRKELQAKKDVLQDSIRESNAFVMGDHLSDKAEYFHQHFQFDAKADFAVPNPAGEDVQSDNGIRLVLEGEISFRLPGIDRDINLPRLSLAMQAPDRIDYNKPVLEMIPTFLISYFSKEMIGIMSHLFPSAISLVNFLINLLKGGADENTLSTLDEHELGIKLLQGIGGLDRETAEHVWKAHQAN